MKAVPRLDNLGFLANPSNAGVPLHARTSPMLLAASNISVAFVPVTRHEELPEAFTMVRDARPDALLVLVEPLIAAHRAELIEFAASTRLLAIHDNGPTAKAGGLMSYALVFREHYALAARVLPQQRFNTGCRRCRRSSSSPKMADWLATVRVFRTFTGAQHRMSIGY